VSGSLIAAVQSWQNLGLAGLGGLSLVFALGALVYVPRFTLYLSGGLLFGLAAAPAAIVGTTIGAVAAFLLARHVCRAWVLRRVTERPMWQRVLAAIDAEGWRLVALVRFGTPIPGGGINYLFGLTGIGLWPYAVATFAGLIPPVMIFVALGAFGRMAVTELAGSPEQQIATVVAVAAVFLSVMLVLRRISARILPARPPAAGAGR
jgi:uncharacterized membrane protein YdjX (TVP38/TMEM64 family)